MGTSNSKRDNIIIASAIGATCIGVFYLAYKSIKPSPKNLEDQEHDKYSKKIKDSTTIKDNYNPNRENYQTPKSDQAQKTAGTSSKEQTVYNDNYLKNKDKIKEEKYNKLELDSDSLLKSKNYEKALEGFLEIEKNKQEKFGTKSLEKAEALHKIGVCYFYLSLFHQAIDYLSSADEIMVKNFFTNSSIYPRNLSYLAFANLKENNLKTAGDLAKKAKELYERNRISDDTENALIFSVLGYLHFNKGEDDKAREALEKAEILVKKSNDKYNEMNMNNLYYLGQIYLKKGLFSEALNKFCESHGIAEEIKFLDVEYHIYCLENTITLFEKIGNKDAAAKYMQKLKIFKL